MNSINQEMNNILKKKNSGLKGILMQSIILDDDERCIEILANVDLELDDTYFDYTLLKGALYFDRGKIANILVNEKGCRVVNNKVDLEETPLHLAMKLKDLSVVSAILNKDASIYDKNLQGDTPLHAAFKEGHYSSVNVVLDYITTCNLTFNPNDKDDLLHFHIACISKHINSVKLFLSLGFDVNSRLTLDSTEFSGLTPLQYLISKKDYSELFQILLDRSDLSITDSNGLTALHSIYYNNEDKIWLRKGQEILAQAFKHENYTKFINKVDNNGVTHFHLCCITDSVDCVKVFIESGVDINSSVSSNCFLDIAGFTPLHFAVKYCQLEIVKLLLKNGADCNRSDNKGRTPLHFACECGNDDTIEIIEILLDHSANPVYADKLGNTFIHIIFHSLAYETAADFVEKIIILDKLMSKESLKVNLTDEKGLSFFHIICARNNPDQLINFLNSGVAINNFVRSGAYEGYTALHFAVLFNQKNVVEILLRRNAQVNINASYVDTPLHFACQCTHYTFCEIFCEYVKKCQANDIDSVDIDWISNRTKQVDIIKLLLLHGADVEATNDLDYTPLFSAFDVSKGLIVYWSDFGNDLINEINTRLLEITKLLLSNKANINGSSENENSIFCVIGKNGLGKISDELMECLITAGGQMLINASDRYRNPLHCAVEESKNELVEMFMKHKADVNAKSKGDSQTPLQYAIDEYEYLKDLEEDEDIKSKLCKSNQLCIKILLENGSDVNIKTSDGRSLLHVAVSASSTFLIENLLYYGADINVEDSLGSSPVCSLLKNGEINEMDISCIIFMHVQKLLAFRLYVNDKVQKFCYCLLQYVKNLESKSHYNSIRDGFDRCIDELNVIKMRKIDNYTTLYDILLKDSHELSKHMRNKSFIEILEAQDIDETFPLYNYLLKLQYKKGLLRSEILEDAERSLIYVTSLNLPKLCYDLILKYLTNEEVINLKAAAAGKTKRKLSDNYSSEAEPSIKLLKS